MENQNSDKNPSESSNHNPSSSLIPPETNPTSASDISNGENGSGEIEEKRKELEVAEFMCGIQQK